MHSTKDPISKPSRENNSSSIDQNYREKLFHDLSNAIQTLGNEDPKYDYQKRTEDILVVLEELLAISIFSISIDRDTIRDAAEQSYVNIKSKAMMLLKQETEAVNKKES